MTLSRKFLRDTFLSAVGPLKRISPAVHILNGHIIGMDERAGQEKFRSLLRKLSKVATLVRVEEACDMVRQRRQPSRPMIAFTFDDGFIDCYRDIAPVLEEFGTNALFFINPNFTNGNKEYVERFLKKNVPDLPPRPPMNAAMVRELADRGFVIGAHTMDHERMTSDVTDFLKAQIVDCRAAVENLSGKPCDYFAWTYGRYSDISEAAIQVATQTYKFVFSSERYAQYTSPDGKILNRRHFECDWPFAHLKYFLSSARRFC
jgi:peptidoglycan/xylan/chitin deacetylase (PgdA/CDA1 family)